MTTVDIFSLALIVFLGIPHGSLDGVIARRLGWSKNLIEQISFNVIYLSIAILVVIVWFYMPLISLSIFLVISGIHFGMSDISKIQNTGSSYYFSLISHAGLIPIALPVIQKDYVIEVFTILSNNTASKIIFSTLETIFPLYLVIVSAYFFYSIYNKKWLFNSVSLIILILLAFLIPPLLTFALYFCFWHSRGHMLRIWQRVKINERRSYILETVGYTIFTWLILASGLWLLDGSLNESIIKMVFIGLAALTVPHMILVDFWANRRKVL